MVEIELALPALAPVPEFFGKSRNRIVIPRQRRGGVIGLRQNAYARAVLAGEKLTFSLCLRRTTKSASLCISKTNCKRALLRLDRPQHMLLEQNAGRGRSAFLTTLKVKQCCSPLRRSLNATPMALFDVLSLMKRYLAIAQPLQRRNSPSLLPKAQTHQKDGNNKSRRDGGRSRAFIVSPQRLSSSLSTTQLSFQKNLKSESFLSGGVYFRYSPGTDLVRKIHFIKSNQRLEKRPLLADRNFQTSPRRYADKVLDMLRFFCSSNKGRPAARVSRMSESDNREILSSDPAYRCAHAGYRTPAGQAATCTRRQAPVYSSSWRGAP